jgi:hypothetical protein
VQRKPEGWRGKKTGIKRTHFQKLRLTLDPPERRVVLLKTCTFCPPTKELHVKTKAGLNNLSLPYLCKKSHRLRKYDLKFTCLDLFVLNFVFLPKVQLFYEESIRALFSIDQYANIHIHFLLQKDITQNSVYFLFIYRLIYK